MNQDEFEMDQAMIEEGVRTMLIGLGEDPQREGLQNTPARFAKMMMEMTTPPSFTPTTFSNEDDYDQIVMVSNIPFYSQCEHHLVPFFGQAHIGYLPQADYIGLSKFPRVVEYFARRLQVQERLTTQIANWVMGTLNPLGVGVIIKARHLCMEMRGVKKPGTETTTSAMLGQMRDNPNMKNEFLNLVSQALT